MTDFRPFDLAAGGTLWVRHRDVSAVVPPIGMEKQTITAQPIHSVLVCANGKEYYLHDSIEYVVTALGGEVPEELREG